ncbi:MAG: MopE-related protein [Myxococcota bacterium]
MRGLVLVLLLAACAPDPAPAPHDTGPTYSVICKGAKCSGDGDGCEADRDCDDNDSNRCEDFAETCDGIDNDCDDVVDDGVTATLYADIDGDGFGAGDPVEGCEGAEGWVTNADDCDDTDRDVHPDAAETCDLEDDDCDGDLDEGVTSTFHADADADGFGDAASPVEACAAEIGWVANADDCDDADPDEPVVVHEGESVQAAVAAADLCVYAYAGHYGEDLDLLGKDLFVWAVEGPDATVLTGSGEGPVVRFVRGESARLAGFTITGGAGEDDGNGRLRGGGVLVHGATPTLTDVVVTGNTADLGAGIAVVSGSLAGEGLGVEGNVAAMGGGLHVATDAVAELAESRVEGNAAPVAAGIMAYGLVRLDHVLVAGQVGGPAIDVAGPYGSLLATHVTWADNDDVPLTVGTAATADVTQSLLSGAGDLPCVDGDSSASLSLTYTAVHGCAAPELGPWGDLAAVDGNVSGECPFVDAAAGDYRLAGASPCVDALAEPDCEDTPGDMGAFEGASGCW